MGTSTATLAILLLSLRALAAAQSPVSIQCTYLPNPLSCGRALTTSTCGSNVAQKVSKLGLMSPLAGTSSSYCLDQLDTIPAGQTIDASSIKVTSGAISFKVQDSGVTQFYRFCTPGTSSSECSVSVCLAQSASCPRIPSAQWTPLTIPASTLTDSERTFTTADAPAVSPSFLKVTGGFFRPCAYTNIGLAGYDKLCVALDPDRSNVVALFSAIHPPSGSPVPTVLATAPGSGKCFYLMQAYVTSARDYGGGFTLNVTLNSATATADTKAVLSLGINADNVLTTPRGLDLQGAFHDYDSAFGCFSSTEFAIVSDPDHYYAIDSVQLVEAEFIQ